MTYVMSDIHGNKRRFDSIMQQISMTPDDTLYILGDVIDRFPDGIRILRQIMKMPNVKMLLGNHEHMMLAALGYPYNSNNADGVQDQDYLRMWYRNGGKTTHFHLKHIRKELRRDIFDYLRALPLSFSVNVNDIKYKLVHAAPPELFSYFTSEYEDEVEFAVWHRWDDSILVTDDSIVVFGHTPTISYQQCNPLEVLFADQCIDIDCGSGYAEAVKISKSSFQGRLACIRLDDMRVFYSEENSVQSDK